MRIPQPEGERGSLKWIQKAIELAPECLLTVPELSAIDWVSPLRHDNFAEYRDYTFLDVLGISHLRTDLAQFWPSRGSQWDALGRAGDKAILVETKAHIGEFLTPGSAARPASLAKIEQAFNVVKAGLKVSSQVQWSKIYYQYANRLAFLYFLRSRV